MIPINPIGIIINRKESRVKLIQTIGNTPLLALERLSGSGKPVVYAKAEFMNPSGSVKDRAAANMIQEGIARGNLTSGKTILDATSGNTGIAYAMLGDLWESG